MATGAKIEQKRSESCQNIAKKKADARDVRGMLKVSVRPADEGKQKPIGPDVIAPCHSDQD